MDPTEEMLTALFEDARGRFGRDRAEALRPELAALAADLARVAAAPVPVDGEPGFFLLEE